MRGEQEQAKRGPARGLMAAVMGLALVTAFFLSLVAPRDLDTPFMDDSQPEAAALVSGS